MARTFSQNVGKLTLQKGNVLSTRRLSEKGKPKLIWIYNALKDVKLL
jgi:hypothetical protein